jgi:ACS family hexuronate transporter-like MFS transporter
MRQAVPPYRAVLPQARPGWGLLRDRRLIRLASANVLWMIGFVLWGNWTTIYLVRTFRLTQGEANNGYAWIPPLVSVLGAFMGGWLSRRSIAGGMGDVAARRQAILVSAVGCLAVALAPLCGSPALATAAISASYFWTLAGSVNLYTIPVDIWGGERAGTAISALVFSYGALQTVVSPGIGWMVGRFGFGPVCLLAALPPLVAWWVLRGLGGDEPDRAASVIELQRHSRS